VQQRMRRPESEEARDLQVLDRYLSFQASRVFADSAVVATRRADAPPTESAGRPRLAVAALVAVVAFLLVVAGQAGTGQVAVPSLRGAPVQLGGVSSWRDISALELAWISVRGSSHYSVQVWDPHGRLIANRVVGGTKTKTTIGIPTDVPQPLLWAIVAWKDTRRLAVSDVMTAASKR